MRGRETADDDLTKGERFLLHCGQEGNYTILLDCTAKYTVLNNLHIYNTDTIELHVD